MNNKLKKQILAVFLVILVAGLGTLFVVLGMDWFNSLAKPSQWIPNFVIPIVWTVIYSLVAVYLVVQIKNDKLDTKNVIIFAINGLLNVLWCLVFFTLNQTLLGLIVIVLNLIASIVLFVEQEGKDILTKLLLIYPTWLSIATCLNLSSWILN